MAESFCRLPPSERVAALKSIIASLSPVEACIARRELLLSDGTAEFDLIACLPSELVHRVFGLLDPHSLSECSKVSRIWRRSACASNVVHEVVRAAGFSSSLPAAVCDDRGGNSDYCMLRRLNEREERWASCSPVLSKAIPTIGTVTALALSNDWAAASIGRRLRAWKISRAELRLAFDVWTHAAKSIAICPSGGHLAYSSYLRTATVYALADSSELFSVTSPVEGIISIDLHLDLLAVLKQNGSIDIYNWKQRRQISSIHSDSSKLCVMKLCSQDWLIAASKNWNTQVFRVENGSLAYTAVLAGMDPDLSEKHVPRLKAIERYPGFIYISVYGEVKQVRFAVNTARRCIQKPKLRMLLPNYTILDATFARVLFVRYHNGDPHSCHILHTAGDRVLNEIIFPRLNTLLKSSIHRKQAPSSLPMTTLDDNTALIADNSENVLIVQRFSH
ncbi:hypothetical protein COEREDRAFT_16692 [Coemansia reversa NRRL 1564]|uniref:F-box domain-containing protein n=1 Tax=Coemansia reversa (strain ATCC 12441 / NRRL 1564) TaxID=763665 RepID=A0A2G5B6R8_COERN|nr:hypothetical protein COEREDRAFT_16692 [Coemansia reversa NRRL 1564]|eukprot:PIA14691.1 hypothetical protein COEREDRAFT_16692 [Coemansia reversa NRRL 1564]